MKKLNYIYALALSFIFYPQFSMALECDLEKGEKTFSVCKTCHTASKTERNFVGPNLFAIVGRDIASKDDFYYSQALTEKKGVWDEETLNDFLKNPEKSMPGTMMAFGGIKDERQRENLICFLKKLK